MGQYNNEVEHKKNFDSYFCLFSMVEVENYNAMNSSSSYHQRCLVPLFDGGYQSIQLYQLLYFFTSFLRLKCFIQTVVNSGYLYVFKTTHLWIFGRGRQGRQMISLWSDSDAPEKKLPCIYVFVKVNIQKYFVNIYFCCSFITDLKRPLLDHLRNFLSP